MRKELFKNLHAGIGEAIDKLEIFPAFSNKGEEIVGWNDEAVKIIAKHVEPFKQLSEDEQDLLTYALAHIVGPKQEAAMKLYDEIKKADHIKTS